LRFIDPSNLAFAGQRAIHQPFECGQPGIDVLTADHLPEDDVAFFVEVAELFLR
jgi:hypothetical protein